MDVGLDFRPDFSLTIPLINKNIDLSDFGLDTVAYETVHAIKIPLNANMGIQIPLNILNRPMPNKVLINSNIINSAMGTLTREKIITVDTMVTAIQNSSLAAAFNQAIIAGNTPPIISQAIFQAKGITIGQLGGSYSSTLPLEFTLTIENFQNANINCRFQVANSTESELSQIISIAPGATHSTTVQLSQVGDFPIDITVIDLSYMPLGALSASSPLFKTKVSLRQDFIQFDSQLDTAIWENSNLQFLYLDSLSSLAPRSEINFRPNTNFFFNFSSNMGIPMRRKIINNGNLLVDIPTFAGQTSQYSVGGQSVFGNRDTFNFQSVYYSNNSAIPNSTTTRQITTTDVHAFANPIFSRIELKNNLPLTTKSSSSSNLTVPFIDTAEFYNPILSVGIESDVPLEIEFQLSGENFPNGLFQTDSVQKALKLQTINSYREIFTFDSSNSHLNSLSSLPMDSVLFVPKIELVSNGNLFSISETSNLRLSPELILPLQGKLRGVIFYDTLVLELDTTLIHYSLQDTIRLDFGTSNPATLGVTLRIQLYDSLNNLVNNQSSLLIKPSPYETSILNGLAYVESKSSFYIQKTEIKQAKKLVYSLEIGGDADGMIRLPAAGIIRLEASLVLP